MNKKFVITAATVFLVTIGVYIVSRDSYGEKFDEFFKKSFRKTFVGGCIGDDKSQEMSDLCNCAADEALVQLSVKELMDQKNAVKYVQDQILSKCAEKLGLEITL